MPSYALGATQGIEGRKNGKFYKNDNEAFLHHFARNSPSHVMRVRTLSVVFTKSSPVIKAGRTNW